MYTVDMRTDDRLQAGWDKGLFFIIFVSGSILILLEKQFALASWVAPTTGATAILLFCAVTWKSPRFRLREDRIGDGAYYLGFLFTLVSLSYALYQFTEEGGTEGVISGFGIALTTTIVGLALRVVFQQLREDPIEIEQEVRQTLSNEVLRLEREVRLSVEALVALRDRTNEEMSHAIGAGLQQLLKDSRDAISAQTEVFKTSIDGILTGVKETTAALKLQAIGARQSSSRLLKSIELLAEKIERSEPPTKAFTERIDEFSRTFDLMIRREAERIDKAKESAEAIVNVYREMETRAVDAAASMGECKKAIDSMHVAIKDSMTSTGEVANEAKVMLGDLVERHRKQIEVFDRVGQMSSESEKALRTLIATLEGQVKLSSSTLAALQRNIVQASELIVKELRAQ